MSERRLSWFAAGIGHNILCITTLVVLVTLMGACTDQPDIEEAGTDTTAVTMDTFGAMEDTTGAAKNMTPDTVDVTLTNFDIDMPQTLDAGPTVFRVSNEGTVPHNFEVEGQGIEREFESKLQPGTTEHLRVDLESGSYVIYCPVADHRARGMELQLSVSDEPTSTAASPRPLPSGP